MTRLLSLLVVAFTLLTALPAHAGLSAKAGTFTVSASDVATTQIPITWSADANWTDGDVPKFVLLFWNGRDETINAAGRASHQRGMGVAVSSTVRWTVGSTSVDAGPNSSTSRHQHTTACIITLSSTVVTGAVDVFGMVANGFTLIVDTQLAADLRVSYLAFSGTDITNVAVGEGIEPATATTATFSPGFAADMAVFGTIGSTLAGSATGADSRMAVGFAARSPAAQGVWSGGSDHASSIAQAFSYTNDVESLVHYGSAGMTLTGRARVTGWGATDVTLTWDEVDGAANRRYQWLAVKGGSWSIGSFLTLTDTTNVVTIGSLPAAPRGGMILSGTKAESVIDTRDTDDKFSVGVFSLATSQSALGTQDRDAALDMEVATAIRVADVYVALNSAGAVEGAMKVDQVLSDNVTLKMTDADPTQKLGLYLIGGGTAAGGGGGATGGHRPLRGVGQ